MNLKALLLGTGVLLSIVAFNTARVGATPLAQYKEITLAVGDCGVRFGHGTYGGAYAYYKDIFRTCGADTHVRVTGKLASGPYITTASCGRGFTANTNCRHDRTNATYTTLITNTTLVESRAKICTSNNHVCQNYTFTP